MDCGDVQEIRSEIWVDQFMDNISDDIFEEDDVKEVIDNNNSNKPNTQSSKETQNYFSKDVTTKAYTDRSSCVRIHHNFRWSNPLFCDK